MKFFTTCAIAVVACAIFFQSSTSAQTLSIDNFEEYTSGQAIATSSTSTPWLRFGAVEDNLYATKGASQDSTGTLGAQIPVDPAATTGFAITARNYGAATDFTAYTQATVLSKSEATTTADSLKLFLSDGSTTYVSTVAQAESTTSQMFTFPLASTAFTRTGGSDSYATVLSSVTEIGFQVGSSTGAGETLAFDDFAAEATPEPGTAGIALLGGGIFALKRRRSATPVNNQA